MNRTKIRTSFLAALRALLVLIGADSLASEFEGNHLFIADPGNQLIRELDANGAVVRLLGGSILVSPQRLTVGPDGNLYVLDDYAGFSATDHLVVLSADGDLIADLPLTGLGSFDAALAPEPYFAPNGRLLLIDDLAGAVYEVDPATGAVVATHSDPSISEMGGVRVTARGQFIVTTTDSASSLAVFEPDGTFLGPLDSPSLGSGIDAPLLLDGPNGSSFVLLRSTAAPTTAELHALATDGSSNAQRALTNGPYLDMRFGPDGQIWVLGDGGSKLFKIDPSLAEEPVQAAFLPAPGPATGFVFAPFRIRLKASGSEVSTDSGSDDIPSNGYVISYFPGAERVAFQFNIGEDAAIYFGSDRPTFHGTEPFASTASNRRVQVLFAGERAGANVGLATFLKFKGVVNATTGYYRPKSASGTLDISSSVGQFHAELAFVKVME